MKSLLPHQCHRSCTAFHLLVPAASCIPSWLHTYLPLFTGPPHPCHTLLPSLVWQLGYYFSPKECQSSRDVLITPLQTSWAVWQRETLEAGLPSMRRACEDSGILVHLDGQFSTWTGGTKCHEKAAVLLSSGWGWGGERLGTCPEPRVAAWLITRTFLSRMRAKQEENCVSKRSFLTT